jgi:hypothetical protein
MCQQQFQAEVMDQLAMLDIIKVCVYCGNPVSNNQLNCCGENHFEYVEMEHD